jgi:hypothetical protein
MQLPSAQALLAVEQLVGADTHVGPHRDLPTRLQ